MNNQTILIVNDAPDQLELLAFLLGKAGYRILSAADGADGLKTARRELPDLIISDVIMPEMDGIEFCRKVRADKKLGATPFLLVSGLRKDAESVVEGLEAGADDYIEVPYEPILVVARAARLIERKRTDDVLRESETRFRTMIENATDIISILSTDGTIIYESSSIENILGYKPEELIGLNAFSFIQSDDLEKFIDYFNLAIDNLKPNSSIEYRFRHKDNSWRIIESVGKSFTDPDKGSVVVINSRDITGRKQTESALRVQKSLLEAQSEASIDGVLVVAPNDEIISYNQRFVEMWEISADALAAKSDKQLLKSVTDKLVDPQKFLANIDYLHQHPNVKDHVEINLKDGRTFEWFTAPVIGGDNAYLGRIRSFRDITNRKEIEGKLRESKERYHQLFDSNPLPMWVYDVETLRFLAVNTAAIAHYGYSRKKFASMTIKDIRPSEDIPALLEDVSKMSGGIDAAGFWRHRKKNGEIIDVEITSHEMVFDNRRAKIVLAIDVTERKKAGEAIRFQAHLLNTVEQAVIATDLNGVVVYWNRFAQKLYGWTAGEAVGRNIMELTTPETVRDQAADIMLNLGAGGSWLGEFSVKSKDGRIFPAQVMNTPIQDSEDNLVGIVGISFDITERNETEKNLAQASQRALREYEHLLERIAHLAESLGTARDLITIYRALYVFAVVSTPCTGFFISLYDAKRNVRIPAYVSSDGEEIDVSHLPPMEMSGSPNSRAISTGSVIIEDDFQAATEGKPVVEIGLDKYPDLPQSCLVVPMSVMGRIIGAVEVQSSIPAAYTQENTTALRMAANIVANAIENVQLLEQERLSAEQLRQSQKLESVGRLAGGIAHDFNNMLTAINGYSDLTLRRLSADDPLRRNVEEIKKAGERSASLTAQLLAFSRRQVLKTEILEVNKIVTDTSAMLQRLIGEDIQLNISLDPKLGHVEADPGQLTQVIMNLAVNARDAMPDGGDLIIETSNVYLDEEYALRHVPTQPGDYVMLAVSDGGTGIGEDTLVHIFEPFYTTKETGKGTGLGLAQVYGIVKQSGGYIWVYSELGIGTTFKIYLPRVSEPAALAAENRPSEVLRTGTETILLVEDETVVRKMSRQMLEVCGYQVIEARNGVEAISICESQKPKIDLLLTDVVMPQMGGRELAERLIKIYPDIRLIYTSGYTDDAIIRRGMITEDMNFVQKPFNFEVLTKKVRESLDAADSRTK